MTPLTNLWGFTLQRRLINLWQVYYICMYLLIGKDGWKDGWIAFRGWGLHHYLGFSFLAPLTNLRLQLAEALTQFVAGRFLLSGQKRFAGLGACSALAWTKHGAYIGSLGLMECKKYVLYVIRKRWSSRFRCTAWKNRMLGKFVKNALFVVCNVTIFYQSISCA